MSASYVAAYNVTDRPIVVDVEGRTLGGYEWGAVFMGASEAAGASVREDLIELDGDADPHGPAKAAADEAARLNERLAQFGKLDRSALMEYVGEHGGDELVPRAADWSLDDVRHALTVRTAIPTPASRRSSSTEEK